MSLGGELKKSLSFSINFLSPFCTKNWGKWKKQQTHIEQCQPPLLHLPSTTPPNTATHHKHVTSPHPANSTRNNPCLHSHNSRSRLSTWTRIIHMDFKPDHPHGFFSSHSGLEDKNGFVFNSLYLSQQC